MCVYICVCMHLYVCGCICGVCVLLRCVGSRHKQFLDVCKFVIIDRFLKCHMFRVGQNLTNIGIQCTYGIFSKEITIHTVIYGADIRFWPTLHVFLLPDPNAKAYIYKHPPHPPPCQVDQAQASLQVGP